VFGHVGAFSQVSVVFKQENPLNLDYMRRAVGPNSPMRALPSSVGEQTVVAQVWIMCSRASTAASECSTSKASALNRASRMLPAH
jgi:hypothetical protein